MPVQSNHAARDLWSQMFARAAERPAAAKIDFEYDATGEFRQEGEGNTVATGVGVLAIGVFAGFITGKRARLPQGRELLSQLAQPVPFTLDGKLSPSFDPDAAVAAAAAKTEIGRCKIEAAKEDTERKREKAADECYKKRLE